MFMARIRGAPVEVSTEVIRPEEAGEEDLPAAGGAGGGGGGGSVGDGRGIVGDGSRVGKDGFVVAAAGFSAGGFSDAITVEEGDVLPSRASICSMRSTDFKFALRHGQPLEDGRLE